MCQEVISLLHLNPDHITTIISHPGWESLFLWLLTTEEEGNKKGKKKKRNEEKTTKENEEESVKESDKESSSESGKEQREEATEKRSSSDKQQQGGGTNGGDTEQQHEECDDSEVHEDDDVASRQEGVQQETVNGVEVELEVSLVNQFGHSPHRQRTGAMSRPTPPPVAWYQLHGLEDEVWRSCAVVTETIVYVLWQVVRNQEEKKPWKLFGTVVCITG